MRGLDFLIHKRNGAYLNTQYDNVYEKLTEENR